MNNLQKAIEAKNRKILIEQKQQQTTQQQPTQQLSPLQQKRLEIEQDMQKNISELADLIRITRNQQLMSQRELAALMGYSQATITRAEKGTVAYTTLFLIASALGTKLTLINK